MKNAGFIYALLASITWGLVYIIAEKVLIKVPPLILIILEYSLTAVFLIPLIFLNFEQIKSVISSDKTSLILIIALALMVLVANFFIVSSLKLLGASTASVLEISYPFFVVLFAFLLFRTPLNWQFLLGAILVFLGSVIILQTSK